MKRLITTLLAGLALAASLPAAAQSFPDRPVTIIVSVAPGGTLDALVQLLSNPNANPLQETRP